MPTGQSSNGLQEAIGQLLTLRHSGTGEQCAVSLAYITAHQSEKREVGLNFNETNSWCPGFPDCPIGGGKEMRQIHGQGFIKSSPHSRFSD